MQEVKVMSIEEIKALEAQIERENQEGLKGIGMYGQMALEYFFDHPIFVNRFLVGNPEEDRRYAKMIDKRAEEIREIITEKLYKLPENALNGDFMHDLQVHERLKQQAHEQILAELIYVDELIEFDYSELEEDQNN